MSGTNLETRSLIDELRSFDSGGFFDLGHPMLNRMAESFIRAAGIGAIQAVSREAYFTALESEFKFKDSIINFSRENNHKSVEALVRSTGKESVQWGLAAGVYSGLTYGLKEARGVHDWKNSALAGAITGAALALTCEDHSHEQLVQCAITGAAISTAANILTGIF
ncbi:Mitochondrial import inner membrane translocase subunit Tim17/Tim22/Tim23 family protein [Perilla frutescens var. frutescens]|nr:Mitochondrial import inner membrane translocase subunit Tim17/Tim22/Tim23 family protein [Perilla frutescens var. frutescens]